MSGHIYSMADPPLENTMGSKHLDTVGSRQLDAECFMFFLFGFS